MIRNTIKRILNKLVFMGMRSPMIYNRISDVIASNPEIFFRMTQSKNIKKAALNQKSFVYDILENGVFVNRNRSFFVDLSTSNPEVFRSIMQKGLEIAKEDNLEGEECRKIFIQGVGDWLLENNQQTSALMTRILANRPELLPLEEIEKSSLAIAKLSENKKLVHAIFIRSLETITDTHEDILLGDAANQYYYMSSRPSLAHKSVLLHEIAKDPRILIENFIDGNHEVLNSIALDDELVLELVKQYVNSQKNKKSQASPAKRNLLIKELIDPEIDTGSLVRTLASKKNTRATQAWLPEYLSQAEMSQLDHYLMKRWRELCSIIKPSSSDMKLVKSYIYDQRNKKQNITLLDLFKIVCPENRVELYGKKFQFTDHKMFLTIFEEIIEHEEYWFACENKQPLIIDCGSNIGLSIVYFKNLYPDAHIIGFEPVDHLRTICEQNIKNYGYKNVTIEPVGLFKTAGTAKMNINKNALAGSIDGLRSHLDSNSTHSVDVKTELLSSYINEDEVDFLKLDIEGAEYDVIKELGDKLKLIKRLFCEFHMDDEKSASNFQKLLGILSKAGFVYSFAEAPWAAARNYKKPSKFTGKPISISIYARRKDVVVPND